MRGKFIGYILLSMLVGYYANRLGEKYTMLLFGIFAVWFVITFTVLLVSNLFFGKTNFRPVRFLILSAVALGTALVMKWYFQS